MIRLDGSERGYERLLLLILGSMQLKKITKKDLADKLRVCPQTVTNYMERPSTIPLRMLPKLCRALEIPADELRAALPMK